METNNLLRSTFTDDCRTQKGDQKTCLLCGLSYFWRPSRCRTHLGLAGSTKQVQLCKPYPEHCDRFSEVVRELKERDTQTDQAAREVTKRSLESGAPDDAIIVDNFCKKARVSNDRQFKIVRTRDEVAGGVKEITLPHRTYFITKLIPKLDKFIDLKNMGNVREMTEEMTVAFCSDGWTAVNQIVNRGLSTKGA